MYQPEKLKARRKELKMTQKEIADRLGISYQAYSAWERGVKEPSKEKVKRLEQILRVPKGYFTEIEIVRLYNTLSNKGKNQVLEYTRKLVQEESRKLLRFQKISMSTMYTKRCRLVSVPLFMMIATMTLFILMKN